MVARVMTGMVQGVEGLLIKVETDLSQGLPMMNLFGSLSAEVREGKERVRTALKNTGIRLPPDRITINLSPGDIRKNGTSFDLAIAVSLLIVLGLVPEDCAEDILFLGELSLNGDLMPVHGVLPVVKTAYDLGYRRCLVPVDNVEEALLVRGMHVWGFRTLNEVYDCCGKGTLCPETGEGEGIPDDSAAGRKQTAFNDFAEVKGQILTKRALEIAVAGFHNVYMEGPPGVGKSMIASCVPGIMPEMTMEEKIETTMIYSVRGLLQKDTCLVGQRPFRSPSHNVSIAGLFGGGRDPVPGEISLAHHGVLFMDEFPEYRREILEMLRVPLEEHRIVMIRNNRIIEMPADFILIAAANPCPCGYYPDRRRCRCSSREIQRYQSKVSGPLKDRMDLFVRCEDLTYEELMSEDGDRESSSVIREKVTRAWDRQKMRFGTDACLFNGRMSSAQVRRFCMLTEEGSRMLAASFKQFQLSGRAYNHILKVARTIADLQQDETISSTHLEEALLFRNVSVSRQ